MHLFEKHVLGDTVITISSLSLFLLQSCLYSIRYVKKESFFRMSHSLVLQKSHSYTHLLIRKLLRSNQCNNFLITVMSDISGMYFTSRIEFQVRFVKQIHLECNSAYTHASSLAPN